MGDKFESVILCTSRLLANHDQTYIQSNLLSNQKQIGASKATKFGVNKIQNSSDVNCCQSTELLVGQQLGDRMVSGFDLERILIRKSIGKINIKMQIELNLKMTIS